MIVSLAAAAAVLLTLSGAAKLRSPVATVGMLPRLAPFLRRSPVPLRQVVRVIALVEISVGVAFLALGGRVPAALLALTYLIFTAVAVRLLAQGGSASCGCFGAADSPISVAHVVLDLVAAGVGVAAVLAPAGAGAGLPDLGSTTALTAGLQILLLAWLGYLTITSLPALAAARRLEEAR